MPFDLSVWLRDRLVARSCFDQPLVRIGRTPENDVWIDNPVLSRHHAGIRRNGPVYTLEDLRTPNGTFVNGRRIDVWNLSDGDRISIGKFTLVFGCKERLAVVGRQPVTGPETMEFHPGNEDAIERRCPVRAELVLKGERGTEHHAIERDVFLIGGAADSDLYLPRGPGRLAMIARGHGGFSILNVAGRDVSLDAKPVELQAWLRPGSLLDLAGFEATFTIDAAREPEAAKVGSLTAAIQKTKERSQVLRRLDLWFEKESP